MPEKQTESGLYRITPAEDPDGARPEKEHIDAEEQVQETKPNFVTAFLVVLQEDGRWIALFDPSAADGIMTSRLATQWDIIPACAGITADVESSLTAAATIQAQVQIANQAQQQAQAMALQEAIAAGRNPLEEINQQMRGRFRQRS